MKKDTVVELRKPAQEQDLLSTMLREGAQRLGLLAQAVQAEFEVFLGRYSGKRIEGGRAAVVRNGFQPEREVLTGLGPVTWRASLPGRRRDRPTVSWRPSSEAALAKSPKPSMESTIASWNREP